MPTKCVCSQDQKQRARRLFVGASEPRPLHLDPSAASSETKINTLPREILHNILKIVYDGEERSRDLCRCARPKSPYAKVKKAALEHRIANTFVLRNVCQAFHKWCLEEILRGHPFDDSIGVEIEVDFSNFERLEKKFGKNGSVVSRLVEDFPAIQTSGIIIYLGSPGDIRNITLVLEMLKATPQNFFSGVTLWDLNYYFRDFGVEFEDFLRRPPAIGKSHFNIDEFPELGVDELPPRVLSRRFVRLNQIAKDSWADICYDIYSEAQFIYGSLLSQLALTHWPHSTVHIPTSITLDLTRLETEKRTIAGLLRGCTSVVFREFKSRFVYNWVVTKEIIGQQIPARRSYEPRMNSGLILRDADFTISDWEKRTSGSRIWCGMSHQISEPLDAVRVEYRHQSMPNKERPKDQNRFTLLSSTFKDIEQCVVLGGNSWSTPLEEMLKALLPTSDTLKTFIHRPEHLAGASHITRSRPELHYSDHTCFLIRRFPKLQNLEVQSRICPSLFEDDDDLTEVPVQRRWVFDLIESCRWDALRKREETEGSLGDPQTVRQHKTVAKAIEELSLACRNWKNRHELRMGKRLDWHITYHTILASDDEDYGGLVPCSHRDGNCRLVASFHEA